MAQNLRIQFAKRLRSLRKRYGWTQEQLAERADLAYRHVQRLESLTGPPPAKLDTLEKLARAFQLSPARLLEFDQLAGYLTGASHELTYLLADAKLPMALGKRIRHLRKQRGLSQQRLAELAHVDPRDLQQLEEPRRAAPRPETLRRLAKAFDMTIADLLQS
jgi:transcriptional regulator with XRE-family HTH domain